MALTASRVMQRAYRDLGMLTDFLATGGSITTIIDTLTRYTVDDTFVNGTAFVTRDAGGASAAPEGEYGIVSNYDAASKTWTISAVSVAIASGDGIGLTRSTIPVAQMLRAVDDGLQDLGYIGLVNTSLTSDSNGEIALPVGLKYGELYDVQIEQFPELPFPSNWISIKGQTTIQPAAPGSTATLRGVPVGYTPIITYKGVHPAITSYSSVVSETIPEALAVAATVNKALTWLVSKRNEASLNSFMTQRWNDAKDTLAQVKVEVPIARTRSHPKYFAMDPYVNPRTGSA